MASLLYKLPKTNFETQNVYVFEFQVHYVNLFGKEPTLIGEEEIKEEEWLSEEVKEEEEEEEEEMVKIVEELSVRAESLHEEAVDDSEPQISLPKAEVEEEVEQWIDLELEDLQINELTSKEEYKMIFMNGIEIKPETKKVIISNEVKAILHSLDKIQITREGIKAKMELLNVHKDLCTIPRNEDCELEFAKYEISNNPNKNFTDTEGFLDTLDIEDLPLPAMKKLRVSMALYDIKLIQIDEGNFLENIPKERIGMEEGEEGEYIFKKNKRIEDTKLIIQPQLPVNEDNLSEFNVKISDLKKKSKYKAITSLLPEQMIDRIETIPLLIDISEFDRFALKPIKTIGVSKLGYLGEKFIDTVKSNAEPNARTPHSCSEHVVKSIINNEDLVVGEIKVFLKLTCYNGKAWPALPSKIKVTPSLIELLNCERLTIASIKGETSDLSDEQVIEKQENEQE